jgi:prophage antirepressor-like protein
MISDSSSISFEFDGAEIRFVGSPEIPEWVAADIVSILYPNSGASDRTNLLKGVSSDWKGMKPVHTLGGVQNMVTLFEPGLYSLIVRSNSPIAVRFQRWVFEDVLPSIRQTGSYSITQSTSISTTPPPAREKLENIRLGMDLLYELGGVDERTQLALRDIVRDILFDDKLKKPALASGGRAEWPVSDRARHLGYSPNRTQLQSIGKTVAKFYRLRNDGEKPPEREQFVDGTTRMVKCYGENDLDILDQAIVLIMEPPSQLPPAIDDDEF